MLDQQLSPFPRVLSIASAYPALGIFLHGRMRRRVMESENSTDASARLLPMAEWIYFIHPPRENFAATMTAQEKEVWKRHFERLQVLHREGVVILVGPTLGQTNTGIAIFEAADEATATRIMNEDPAIAEGYSRGELRPFSVSLLRGREVD
jgi:uncharacterized protein YciI